MSKTDDDFDLKITFKSEPEDYLEDLDSLANQSGENVDSLRLQECLEKHFTFEPALQAVPELSKQQVQMFVRRVRKHLPHGGEAQPRKAHWPHSAVVGILSSGAHD